MKKNVGKVSKALGGNARVAMIIAMALLQTSRGHVTREINTTDSNSNSTRTAISAEDSDELWWTRLLFTVAHCQLSEP